MDMDMDMNVRDRRFVAVCVLFVGLLVFLSFNPLLQVYHRFSVADWKDEPYVCEYIRRYPTDNILDIEVIYFYSTDVFTDYFPDMNGLIEQGLDTDSEYGISVTQFMHKYNDYDLSVSFRKVSRSYEMDTPPWHEDLFDAIGVEKNDYLTRGEAAREVYAMVDEWFEDQPMRYKKETDIFVFITDHNVGGTAADYMVLSTWTLFDPVTWGRVEGFSGSESGGKRYFKSVFTHEMLHLFGAGDHYTEASPRFLTDGIMGEGKWDSPYIDSRVLDEEIHWSYVTKVKLYTVPITVSGRVADSKGDPIEDVKIYIDDTVVDETNEGGYYNFSLSDCGRYVIKYYKEGYETSYGGWGEDGKLFEGNEEHSTKTLYKKPVPPDVEDMKLTIIILSGEGSVNPPEGTHYFTEGEEIMIQFSPSLGWEVENQEVYVDGQVKEVYPPDYPLHLTMDTDHKVEVSFNLISEGRQRTLLILGIASVLLLSIGFIIYRRMK